MSERIYRLSGTDPSRFEDWILIWDGTEKMSKDEYDRRESTLWLYVNKDDFRIKTTLRAGLQFNADCDRKTKDWRFGNVSSQWTKEEYRELMIYMDMTLKITECFDKLSEGMTGMWD